MRINKGSTQKPNIRRVHSELERCSVDTLALYKDLDINPDIMKVENSSLSTAKYYELLELAAKKNNDRYIGVKMGLQSTISDLGILGYMLSNSPNLEKAVDLLHRFVTIVAPGSSVELKQESDHSILIYKIHETPSSKCVQALDMTIAQFVLMLRNLLDDHSWQPEMIYLEHAAPKDYCNGDFPIGKNVIFNHYFSGVSFPTGILHQPREDYDPDLLALLEAQVIQSVEHHLNSESLIDHIRLMISSNLGRQEISADIISSELGMSRRTMHRRLSDLGTTFNALREDIILTIAKKSLSHTAVSITELAQKLGYSDSSAFDRAFKRLVGMKPSAYRKEHSVHLS